MTYYKILGADRMPIFGGKGQYPEPGVWAPRVDTVRPCSSGYHLATIGDLSYWLGREGAEIWKAEGDGEPIPGPNCGVFHRVRLVSRVGAVDYLKFTLACVTEALPKYLQVSGDQNLASAVAAAKTGDYATASGKVLVRSLIDGSEEVRHAARLAYGFRKVLTEQQSASRFQGVWLCAEAARKLLGATAAMNQGETLLKMCF